jgi:hypothetical protein
MEIQYRQRAALKLGNTAWKVASFESSIFVRPRKYVKHHLFCLFCWLAGIPRWTVIFSYASVTRPVMGRQVRRSWGPKLNSEPRNESAWENVAHHTYGNDSVAWYGDLLAGILRFACINGTRHQTSSGNSRTLSAFTLFCFISSAI